MKVLQEGRNAIQPGGRGWDQNLSFRETGSSMPAPGAAGGALFTGFRETGSSMLAPGAGGGSPVHWGQAFSLER